MLLFWQALGSSYVEMLQVHQFPHLPWPQWRDATVKICGCRLWAWPSSIQWKQSRLAKTMPHHRFDIWRRWRWWFCIWWNTGSSKSSSSFCCVMKSKSIISIQVGWKYLIVPLSSQVSLLLILLQGLDRRSLRLWPELQQQWRKVPHDLVLDISNKIICWTSKKCLDLLSKELPLQNWQSDVSHIQGTLFWKRSHQGIQCC